MKKFTDSRIEEIIKNAEREIEIQEAIGNKIAAGIVRDALEKFRRDQRPKGLASAPRVGVASS